MSIAFSKASLLPRLRHQDVAANSQTAVLRLVRFGTLVVLIAAPLAFGATTIAASLALVAASWVLFLLWLAAGIRDGELRLSTHPVMLPAVLLLGFTAVHWAAGISANRLATQLEWLRWVGYLALAVVAGESFVTPRRLQRLARTLAIGGLLVALLGLAQYLSGTAKIYWLIEPAQGGWVFGPYVNRNHFAGLMELCIPLALGLALLPQNSFARRWLWCLLALVMGVAVGLSGSRGGVLAVAVEAFALTLAAAALHGGRRVFVGLVLALAIAGGLVLSLDRGEILERYKRSFASRALQQEEASLHRLDAWRGAMEIFRQNWAFGAGLDTFVVHFPAVRNFATDKEWTYAHNEFLQFAAETGLVGIALGLWMFAAGTREAWNNLKRTQHTATGAVLLGMACACLGFLVHGWLDFNLHVPANAANFTVLAAVLTRRGWDED